MICNRSGSNAAGAKRSWLWAIFRMRCPSCRDGQIFESGNRMHQRCPVCQLVYEREDGYFLGAMYFSYFLASALMIGCFFGARALVPDWSTEWIAALAILVVVPFAPWLFRYSRVLWIHYDRWVWPSSDPLPLRQQPRWTQRNKTPPA